jgi:hypothetical protein
MIIITVTAVETSNLTLSVNVCSSCSKELSISQAELKISRFPWTNLPTSNITAKVASELIRYFLMGDMPIKVFVKFLQGSISVQCSTEQKGGIEVSKLFSVQLVSEQTSERSDRSLFSVAQSSQAALSAAQEMSREEWAQYCDQCGCCGITSG